MAPEFVGGLVVAEEAKEPASPPADPAGKSSPVRWGVPQADGQQHAEALPVAITNNLCTHVSTAAAATVWLLSVNWLQFAPFR